MTQPQFTAQQVGEYYNQMAEYYRLTWGGSLHVGYWHPDKPEASFLEAQENLTDLLISQTPVGPGHKVLDVGCGFGRPGTRLSEKTGCAVTGITISQVQADEANRYAHDERGLSADRISFHCMDAMSLPFEAASFDAVWAFECLFHMPDRAQVLSQIARVLRPGGVLVLTDSYDKIPFTPLEKEMIYVGFQVNSMITPDEYRELLGSLGFSVKELMDISVNTAPTVTHVMAATFAKKEELRTVYGDGFFDQMAQMGPTLEEANRQKMCYFLLVAQK